MNVVSVHYMQLCAKSCNLVKFHASSCLQICAAKYVLSRNTTTPSLIDAEKEL